MMDRDPSLPPENLSPLPSPEPATPDRHPSAPSHVVGIGASAGGLEPLEQFFSNMPAHNGMAFVIVQHLSPDYKSLMDQLLARHTQMTIHRVEDGMTVAANAIYLLPPRKDIVIENGALRLSDPIRSERGIYLPIDTFLASLAEDVGEKSIGVVLSGTGSDGTRGIRAIKEAGGTAMVQKVETAQFDGMPRSAISTGLADFVLAPAEMPDALLRYTQHPVLQDDQYALPTVLTEDNQLSEIAALLHQLQGIDFMQYKVTTVRRRILRRMGIVDVPDIEAYIQLLRTSPDERQNLHRDLLIGVTRFFRDPDAFALLEQDVIMPLLQRANPTDPIRVWVAACSTGEEVYAIAMLIRDHLDRLDQRPEVQIFATDVDKDTVEFAAHGLYPDSIAADIGAERLQRFFTRVDNRYRVSRAIREMIIFTPHNLLKDPPFTKMDLITCRNCLIYLEAPMQKKVLSLLHYALNPQGHLFLGSSESVGDLSDEFRTIQSKWKIFQKIRDIRLPAAMRFPAGTSGPHVSPPILPLRPRETSRQTDPLLVQAYERLVEDFCPPILIVNEQYELLRTAGDAAPYLKKPSGAPSLHVLQVIIEDLSVPISTALHKAATEQRDIVYADVRVHTEETLRHLTLHVKWVPDRQQNTALFIISFEESQPARPVITIDESFDPENQTQQRIHDLEQELRYTRENLQASNEELETSNEELQASNEELVAANEELQSTNEELQSMNEELHTVNAEFQSKIQELTDLHNDIDNMLRSTDLGTVFLDRDLHIRKFTPAATTFIHLLEHDIGRPLAHCTHIFSQIDLSHDAKEVLHTGTPIEREVQGQGETWFHLRFLPFLTTAGEAEGVVLTGIETTTLKQSEEAALQSQAQLQQILDYAPAAIYIKDPEGRFTLVNRQLETMRNASSAELIGKTIYDFQTQEIADILSAHDREVLSTNTPITFEETVAITEGERLFLSSKFPLQDASGSAYALCGIATDITEHKQAETELQDAKQTLERHIRELSRLTAILDATSDFVGIADPRENILYLNAAGRRMLGLAEDADLTIRASHFVPEPALQRVRHEGVPAARQHGTWTGELAIIGGDGQEIPVSLVLIAHTSPTGELELLSTIMRDITEELQARDTLRLRADEMETFAYSASHDLQAPLRTFEGYARWLLEDYGDRLDDQGRQLCEEIIDDALHMKTLLDGLLEYSRVGRLQVDATLVDVSDVLEWVLHDLQLEITDQQAKILIPDSLPTVLYPEGRLTQIFSNLISNGLKFTADRPPEITVGWEEHSRHHRFTVQDNGIGIAPEHYDRIFEIFKRLHAREDYPGTGAGLTIVKRIVETHGGEIGVESTLGEGSTFWVTLPKVTAEWLQDSG